MIPKWNGIIVSDQYLRYLVRVMIAEIEHYLETT